MRVVTPVVLGFLACAGGAHRNHEAPRVARRAPLMKAYLVARELVPERLHSLARPDAPVIAVPVGEGKGGGMIAGDPKPPLPSDAIRRAVADAGGRIALIVHIEVDEQGRARLASWLHPVVVPEEIDLYYRTKIAAWRFEPFVLEGRAVPVSVRVLFRYIVE
jgi:hypothetical protein